MQKIIFTLAFLILCLLGRSQLYIQPGAGFKTTGDVQITLDSTGVSNNDVSADFSHCILNFKNTGVALLDGTGAWFVKTLAVNKPGYMLKLGAAVQITNQVQLISGILDLNNQILTLTSGATIEGENNLTYIAGPDGGVVQTTVPLNSPTTQNPGKIGVQITSNQNLGSVTIKRWHKPDGGSFGKVLRFYEIVPNRNTALNASLRLFYSDHELNNNPESSLQLFTRGNSQNAWAAVNSTTKDASLNYIEKTGLPSLQQYSFGTSMAVLPLAWGTISASCKRGKVEVKWSTLQESGIYGFVVQRSTDGSTWSDLGPVSVVENLNAAKDYSYIDAGAPAGVSLYYRIAALEDESYAYSPTASTTGCKKTVTMKLAPVPATATANLSVYSEESYQGIIRLYGADGRIYQKREATIVGGYCHFQIDVSHLSNGTYYLALELPDGSHETISFVKQ